MATITYGKSVVVTNAKIRRHERRRKEAIARQLVESIIDAALGIQETPLSFPQKTKTEIICNRKALRRSIKAIHISKIQRDQYKTDTGSCCIPDVAIYYAGYRQFKNITAR